MALPADLAGPVQVALARSAERLPVSGRGGRTSSWRYELKWDGYRCAVVRRGRRVRLWSRQGTDLTDHFPDVQRALLAQLARDVVLDCELVVWAGASTSFDALQQRLVSGAGRNGPAKVEALAAAQPASLVVFDVLATGNRDLRGHDWSARRAVLEDLAGTWRPPLQLSPVTADPVEAERWMRDYYLAGIEGIVAKDAHGTYRPGQRVWTKVKHRETFEVLVGAVTGTAARPQAIIAGRRDDAGELIVVGRTADLTPAQAAQLAPLLREVDEHPWPASITAHRWARRGDRVRLTRVDPNVALEVSADAARQGRQWRHPLRFVRPRLDLTPNDVPRIPGIGGDDGADAAGPAVGRTA